VKLITRDTDYALRAICFLAKDKRRLPVVELTKALKIPQPFLRKSLQRLNKKGILKSYKGLGGGFLLAMPADKIILTDLIGIFQGPFSLNECFLKKKPCPKRNICALKKKIDRIEKYVASELSSISIADLLK